MLSKLEVTYLGILRVVLLIAATLALLITIGATVTALPALGAMTGVTGSAKPKGGTLKDFVEANRITDVESVADEGGQEIVVPLPKSIAQASINFARYDGKNGGEQLQQSEWDDGFRSLIADKVPSQLEASYGDDLLNLSTQLTKSKGKPLSDARVLGLIQFHMESFLGDAQASENAKEAEIAASMSKLVLAGIAFLVFVLVLFNFIFVKIERNLRPAPRVNEMVE